MSDCIFCKIIGGVIPATAVMENSYAILVKDVHPMAPHHVLAISRLHVARFDELQAIHIASNLPAMFGLIYEYIKQNNLHDTGYRIIINSGADAGQTVQHFHIHLLGGAKLKNDFGA